MYYAIYYTNKIKFVFILGRQLILYNKLKKLSQSMNSTIIELEKLLNSDVISYYGEFFDGCDKFVKDVIETLKSDCQKDTLYVILTTKGGSLNPVVRIVNIFRHHYNQVNFIVPDYAYSAGTVLCMSGDNIFMNYYSALGPIDPQVINKNGIFVPALGYLDKVNELLQKAKNRTLTDPEFIILKEFDLAELRQYEQAKEFTIEMLRKWLTNYKFRNWYKHSSNGNPVIKEDKEKRAIEIAEKLSDNNIWKTHNMPINIDILVNEIKLKIENFDNNNELKDILNLYYGYFLDYIYFNKKCNLFIHSRKDLINI